MCVTTLSVTTLTCGGFLLLLAPGSGHKRKAQDLREQQSASKSKLKYNGCTDSYSFTKTNLFAVLSPSKSSNPTGNDVEALVTYLEKNENSAVNIFYNGAPFTRQLLYGPDLNDVRLNSACEVLGVGEKDYQQTAEPVDLRAALSGTTKSTTSAEARKAQLAYEESTEPQLAGKAPAAIWPAQTASATVSCADAAVSVSAALSAVPHEKSNACDAESAECAEAESASVGPDEAAVHDEAAITMDVSADTVTSGSVKSGGRWLESDAQKKLMGAKEMLHLVDSSNKGSIAMAFQTPRNMYECVANNTKGATAAVVPNVYALSARPDATHSHLPILLEIKPNKRWALLLQAISRVYVQRSTAAYYKKIVTFASHSKIAWVVHYSREGSSERIDIIVIPVASVLRLWLCLEARYPRIEQWLSVDGPLILTTLNRLGLSPRSTLVFHIANHVYGVSTVKWYKYDAFAGGVTVLGARQVEPHFCIKVHTCRTRYEAEAGALCSIYKSLSEEKRKQFYVHRLLSVPTVVHQEMPGHFNDEKELHKQAANIRDRFRCEPLPTTHPFAVSALELPTYFPKTTAALPVERSFKVTPGGCVVMEPGTPIHTLRAKEDGKLWLTAVSRSLRDIHAAGYLHCDLRKSNTMRFGDTVHVIDFDLSVPVEDAIVELERDSGQWNGAGVRIADICRIIPLDNLTAQVEWTPADDMEMATEALLQLMHTGTD